MDCFCIWRSKSENEDHKESEKSSEITANNLYYGDSDYGLDENIFGYDLISTKEKKAMEKREKKYNKGLNFESKSKGK